MNKIIYAMLCTFILCGCTALIDTLKSPWFVEAETAIVEEAIEETEHVHFGNTAVEEKEVLQVQNK